MSDILINAKLPTNCFTCDYEKLTNNCPCYIGICSASEYKNSRHPDCPLEKRPTHGNWHTEEPTESGDYVVWCRDELAVGPYNDPSEGNRLCIASYNSESKTFVNEYDDEMGVLDVKAWWGQKIEPFEKRKVK